MKRFTIARYKLISFVVHRRGQPGLQPHTPIAIQTIRYATSTFQFFGLYLNNNYNLNHTLYCLHADMANEVEDAK